MISSINNIKNCDSQNFFLIAGPCVIESEAMANNIAEKLSDKYDLDGRYLIRNSGTEPLLRELIEAKDTQSVNEFSDELINNIKNYLFT